MKAILVIDVHEFTYEAIKEYFTGVITLHLGNDGFIDFKGVDLKPMQKKVVNMSKDKDNQYYYDLGFNDCIDEILGEQE